jgi:hypothetical protein
MVTTISPKFAHLPNAIIREIIAYTGATFKKRNGKYMGQIPRHDPRYALLRTIPQKHILFSTNTAYTYFCSTAFLLKNKKNDIYLRVSGLTYYGDNKKSRINTKLTVYDGNKSARIYEYDEDQISFTKEMELWKEDTASFAKKVKQRKEANNQLWICSTMFLVVANNASCHIVIVDVATDGPLLAIHTSIPLPKGLWRIWSWLNEKEFVVVIVIVLGDMFLCCFIKRYTNFLMAVITFRHRRHCHRRHLHGGDYANERDIRDKFCVLDGQSMGRTIRACRWSYTPCALNTLNTSVWP